MESVAKAFLFDRFLASERGLDYFTMIYVNKGICQTSGENVTEKNLERLGFGNIENNLVFNFLDYLLWIKHRADYEAVKSYEFTFRSSVEHYYPQNPLPGFSRLDPDILNCFGNLCLISHEKNSRLSNAMPSRKKEFYQNNTIDSVKQYMMMRYESWDSAAVKQHFEDMKKVLLNSICRS